MKQKKIKKWGSVKPMLALDGCIDKISEEINQEKQKKKAQTILGVTRGTDPDCRG